MHNNVYAHVEPCTVIKVNEQIHQFFLLIKVFGNSLSLRQKERTEKEKI